MRLSLVLIISIGLWSCSKTSDNKSNNITTDSLTTVTSDTITTHDLDYESLFKLDSYLTKSIDNKKIETVDYDCAILIYPTDEQIEEMKKTVGEEDFYTIADDSQFYQGTAIGMIDSVGIKTKTVNGQFLRLKGNEKTWDLDIRKKNLPEWNIIFFMTTKEPKIISAIDLTVDEIRTYFEVGEKTNR